MTRCNCQGDNLCRRCLDGIDAAEDARAGRPRAYTERELDDMAEAEARNMVFGRWEP